MTYLDPDVERLGDALRASIAIDQARDEQAARSRGRHAGARGHRGNAGTRAERGRGDGTAGVCRQAQRRLGIGAA
jgi:hypothetical protein